MVKFEKNILIRGNLECITGLHIGGVVDQIGIGGADSPVILDRMRNIPFIPGSSLKGKLRSQLELKHVDQGWLNAGGQHHTCTKEDCDLCVTFGRPADNSVQSGPTRLIIRDSFPTEETQRQWERKDEVVHGTEIKGENALNRITSMANPRFIERVVAGSKFGIEMIFSVYDNKDKARFKIILEAMSHLEDSYLGGSGTRGYGKVVFRNLELLEKTAEDYRQGNDWRPLANGVGKTTVQEMLTDVNL